jgi:AICAR transformylase/IMP cyclohydrolase PurH
VAGRLEKMYSTQRLGHFPQTFSFMGHEYEKVEDLRYGTNPHQPAAFYRPTGAHRLVVGGYRLMKSGKQGLSETNVLDMEHAYRILKYLQQPSVAVMKHLNPSGVAQGVEGESVHHVYIRARDADPMAAFGSVVAFNVPLTVEAAQEIMTSVVEVVVAPGYQEGTLEVLSDYRTYRRNRHLRVILVENLESLPRFVGEDVAVEPHQLSDGSIILSAPLLTAIKTVDDFRLAETDRPDSGSIVIEREPTPDEQIDLLFAWYVAMGIRSNGMVLAKRGETLGIGTGGQDRVGMARLALWKYQNQYRGSVDKEGAVCASDGFIPFRDSIDILADAGVSAVVQPGGSLRDHEVIEAANERGLTMLFTGERCFSHH